MIIFLISFVNAHLALISKYGFITGIGLDRTLLGKTFTFDLRFELGFPSIMDEIEDALAVSDEEGAVKNQAILFLLGIVLN